MARETTQLDEFVFGFTETKTGTVMLSHRGRTVKTLRNKEASRFLNKISQCDETQAQLLIAKLTGQFKFGNETKLDKNSKK